MVSPYRTMTITKVILEDYRSHRHTELALGPLTVLVGPNGCGKTSVLEAINGLCALPGVRSQAAFGHADPPPAIDDVNVRAGASSWSIAIEGLGKAGAWQLKFGGEPRGEHRGRYASWRLGEREGRGNGSNNPTLPVRALWKTLPLDGALPTSQLLRLSRENLTRPSTLEVSERLPELAPDGSGLPAVFGWMKLARDRQYRSVVEMVRRVVPRVCGVSVREKTFTEERLYWHGPEDAPSPEPRRVTLNGFEVVFEMADGAVVPARAASEGTLVTLGLAVALNVDPLPSMVLIDDVERSLHPRGQRELMGAIRELQTARPEVQIAVTTHSPFVVDEVEASSVVVMAQREDGSTAGHRLPEHPKASRLLQQLTNGEFLGVIGEDWVAQEPVRG